MDLPTYTNIWRIEKRLYKLYDVRLPMPLPINWIAVFAGIMIPYIVLLIAIGLPFNHTLVWLYVLPPGLITWLTTRPVIENKRLPELLESQVRYLAEPRTWVRFAPLTEKEQVVVTARVWHSSRPAAGQGADNGQPAATDDDETSITLAPEAPSRASRAAMPGKRSVAPGKPIRVRLPAPGFARPRSALVSAPVAAAAVPGQKAAVPGQKEVPRRRPKVLRRSAARAMPDVVSPQPVQAPRPAASQSSDEPRPSESRPARARGGAPDAALLEMSHDGPGRHPLIVVPPAQPVWPAPPASPVSAPQPEPVAAAEPVASAEPEPVQEPEPAPIAAPASQLEPARQQGPAPLSPPAPAPLSPPPAPAPAPAPPARQLTLERSHEPAQLPSAAQPVAGVTASADETARGPLPSIERALSGPFRDRHVSWHGTVKIVTGAGAGTAQGPGARDQEALDRNRARLPIEGPRRILILGCMTGAGQTVTALMVSSMLASLREQPVAVVDLHDGTLARYRAPAARLDEILAGRPPQVVQGASPDGLHPAPRANAARLDVIAAHEPLRDGDEIKLAVQLNRHYPLTVLDGGPAGLTKLLKVTDQLVLVAPANVEAAGALADTRDWLDAHGRADLATQSVTVINGVSRRSLPDVEQAESIARGRSRAIVRVPWDDMLPVAVTGPSTLRPQTRVAYTALAGVLVAGLAAAPVRKQQ